MKKLLHKILSVLLAACFILSAVPAPAAAAETDSPTTNGSYAGGSWAEGGTGSITYDINGTPVTLSKTAEALGNNEFNITLKVETSTTTSIHTDGGAVVLVIDVSGSMKYCADCGNDVGYEHESDCPKNEPYEDLWGRVQNSDVEAAHSRMLAAKTAATNFLNSYAGDDPTAARMVAIVSFQSSATTRLEWVNVAGKQHDYQTALKTIDDLSADGGTNLDDGLYHALAQLNSDTVKDFSSKNVIALTDGAPTRSRTSGNGTSGSATINSHTAAQATNVRNTGSTLYTVCFGVANESTYRNGPTVGDFLRDSVASSGCAYNADNSQGLYDAFAAITESITSGLSGAGWTATDPMADMISVTGGTGENFSGANGTYTWTLSDAQTVVDGNTTKYVYTYTYRVKLDVQGQNFEEGKYFPTNQGTYLNVDGQQYAFPVPGVQGVLPRTSVTVTKVWNDANDQDGIRPESVTVQLTENGVAQGEPVVLNEGNGWSYTWTGLIKQSKGDYHNYSVEEVKVPDGYTYTATNTANGEETITLTNTHEVYKTDIKVTKNWNDNENQDGKRPESIEVVLKADGVEKATAVLNAENGWSYTWTGLDLNKDGGPIVYTVDEAEVPEGYDKSVDGYIITNSYTPETTTIEGAKTWVDDDNRDNIRPESITINLLADGTKVASQTVTAEDDWKWSFTGMPKYRDGGVAIVYTVTEDAVEGYDATVNGYNVTNTHKIETVSVEGAKTWDDNNNQDGKRPASITINLLANGTKIDSKTVTANDGWKWSFTDLPKNEAGVAIKYTITEDKVDAYTSVVNGYNVTNTHEIEKTKVEGTKTWIDADDQDGKRPTSITINLLANGVQVGSTTITAEDEWKYSFEDIDKYSGGKEIVYTIEEVTVEEYETTINGFDITNTHTPETTEIEVTKVWNDVNDQAGFRPDSVTVNLLANGEKVDSFELTGEGNEWKHTFTNLPVYAAGEMITYTVTEDEVEHYTASVNGFTITNTHVPSTVTVAGEKTWVDNDNQDGIRPDSITIHLLANGEEIDSKTVEYLHNWSWSFENLPEYANGEKIVYTITEDEVEGYETKVDGYNVTNTHAVYKTTVSAKKVWTDADNQDGIRVKEVTVRLWANGVEIDSAKLNDKNNWTYSFTDLDVKANGESIRYAITEDAVTGYETSIVVGERGVFTITNTHEPETVEVSGSKTWNDENNQDGKRPESITINLLADEVVIKTITVTEKDNWEWTFTDLPKYKVGDVGKEVKYTITEDAVAEYTAKVEGYNVTNTHEIETTTITVIKEWDDAKNQDNIRPESVKVTLLADGEPIKDQTVELKEKLFGADWTYTFTDLPVYKAGEVGQKIVYTVQETEVPKGYEAAVSGDAEAGYTITNTHEPETVEVSGSKTWVDAENQDGIRPASITIKLLADGEEIDSKTVNAEDGWKWSFTDLPKFKVGEVGKEVKYTVEEVAIDNYSTNVEGFNVTNTHEIFKTEVTVTKVWDDEDNQDGIRPESVTVKLLADGVEVATAELKDVLVGDDWTYTFTKLPVYKAGAVGQEIKYTVEEADVPEGYEASVTGDAKNGYTITNTHEVDKISVTVTKVWDDADNQDGIRPESITVNIMSNGLAAQKTEVVLSEENEWTYTFEDLDKNAKGKEIKYTVKEIGVPEGYKDEVTGSAEEGFTITNTHAPELIDIDITKKWDDADDQDGKRPESITVNLLANGEIVETVEVKDTFSLRTLFTDDWTYTFTDLPKYAAGQEIEYTITEEAVAGYEAKIEGFTITNVHEPEMTKLDVQKFWDDENDKYDTRADKVKITLYANGKSTGKTITLNEKNKWFDSFEDLPKFENGKEIKYTVKEASLDLYKASYHYDGTKAVVTNTLSEIPNTGDTSGVNVYMIVMAVSAVAVVALVLLNKKKRKA